MDYEAPTALPEAQEVIVADRSCAQRLASDLDTPGSVELLPLCIDPSHVFDPNNLVRPQFSESWMRLV